MYNFVKIFRSNLIDINAANKFEIFLKTILRIYKTPARTHLLAHAADISAIYAVRQMYNYMKNDEEGRSILKEKPLLIRQDIQFNELKKLPKNTLGYKYMEFMETYKLHSHDREVSHFFTDLNYSYILTRYRQIHDIGHVVYNLNISIESEAALKLIELVQTKLPITLLAVLVAPLMTPLYRFQYIFKDSIPSNFLTPNFDFTYNVGYNYLDELSIQQYEYNLTDYFHVDKRKDRNFYWKMYKYYFDNINNSSAVRGSIIYGFENKSSNDIIYDHPNREYIFLKNLKKKYLLFQYKPRKNLLRELYPWAYMAGVSTTKPLHSIHIEKWLDKDIDFFRRTYNISPLPDHLNLMAGIN
ncbi:ubiquinone biosynthesis protein COQ4 like, mitochondrial [Plasmodium inui San Antonio 1]|uniref:Ubiquinone biosynthesis protein COQ4 homolog, mitochondrial n=1 Tax=Plasmodium inui San Antonio 1 TaxID=1237626 RepID=W7A8X0_9APIC|nr:ubiquinone biosynthesis protein COQ4 like, mitochondrial [Plasmodium inui San Antonio 1]EUD65579.1 ubiquinone biosynthesis protein COQ4 like, mitochondrial [Plasmodium inui San Antonio 1]